MSSAPSYVAIKRPRTQSPLSALILEETRNKQSRQPVEYRLQAVSADPQTLADAQTLATLKGAVPSAILSANQQNGDIASTPSPTAAPRQFQLQKKRRADTAGFATFVEQKRRRRIGDDSAGSRPGSHNGPVDSTTSSAFKRPGASASERDWRSKNWKAKTTLMPNFPEPPKQQDPALAEIMHQFALEEIAQEESQKPKVKFQPKRPVRRLRDRDPSKASPVQQQIHVQDEDADMDVDMDMSDDENYVTDIYLRTEKKISAADPNDPPSHSIGYLIITDQDAPVWETYLEEDDDDKSVGSDDEDENAEDYYGADYPEDEVASDDELNQGAYGYRHGGSDDEEWDEDTGAFSDEEDIMRNPWKKYPWMRGPKNAAGSDEENEDEAE